MVVQLIKTNWGYTDIDSYQLPTELNQIVSQLSVDLINDLNQLFLSISLPKCAKQ